MWFCFFFFKQKTAYEMRISDWSSDVCSSDLLARLDIDANGDLAARFRGEAPLGMGEVAGDEREQIGWLTERVVPFGPVAAVGQFVAAREVAVRRSEEHTSELQSLMRISYAVFCLKKKKYTHNTYHKQIASSTE